MATGTLGTAATSSLVSLNPWTPMTAIADIAAIAASILRQEAGFRTAIIPGGFTQRGQLYLPGGRGIIQLKPGDYIGVDHNGWPIVVSKESIADGSSSWAHS
jgi:hypothetical protein